MDDITLSSSSSLSEEEREILLQLRKRIRSRMDGVMASSMREKGVNYPYNFGLSIPQIRELSQGLPTALSFAEYLLATRSRELNILGLILYPIKKLTAERAISLRQQLSTQELRDIYAHHFLSYLEADSPVWATVWEEGTAREEVIAALTRKLLLQLPLDSVFTHRVLEKVLVNAQQQKKITPIEISFLERLALHPDFTDLFRACLSEWQTCSNEVLRELSSYIRDAIELSSNSNGTE